MRGRIPFLVALLTFLLVASGALLTTNNTLSPPAPSALLSPTAHRHAGSGLGALAAALLVWFAIAEKRQMVARLAWAILGGLLLQALSGFTMPALHAILAHVLAAAACALALASSRAWTSEPEFVRDYGWPSMRSLAIAVPALTFVQAALGALFRQQVLGLMPHIVGAMVVSLVILMLGAFVMNQFPAHPRLKPAARAMLALMFTQVFLGIASYTARSIPVIDAAWSLAILAGHVATGALTVAATVAVGMLIRREVQPKA